jgi:hypothetical protein
MIEGMGRLWCRVLIGAAVVAGLAALGGVAPGAALATSTCTLNGPYKHVIYVQYDNTHLARTNPNVPSDLQQIPALKSFLQDQGSLLANDHTILISHTAGGIVSTLTGMYPDHNGIGVSNSYLQYKPDGSIAGFPSAFSYWTDKPISSSDPLPNLVTTGGANAPAPWVPYTRAGCDVGAFSIANMELENTRTSATGDIGKVFGTTSPEAKFANWSNTAGNDPDKDGDAAKDRDQATANFEGIAIHCSQADSGMSGLCSTGNGGKPDNLPDEPGGYQNFNGLFGAINANQVVAHPGVVTPASADDDGKASTPGGPRIDFPNVAAAVKDVFNYNFAGCHFCDQAGSQVIGSEAGNSGFPGFSPSAAQTLGYTAAMQEAGVPVTFAYIRAAHDDQSAGGALNNGNAFGPGQAGYVQQLADENKAYKAFFERLAHDGINKSNTLFVFTVDEGDHFAGGPPLNPGCDGVTTPCQYTPGTVGPNTVGEQDAQLKDALARETGNATPFDIHFDDAITTYVHGQTGTIPSPNASYVRQLERDMGKLTLLNARTGNTDQVTRHIANQTEEGLLHMVTADPLRTPTFTDFANPDYFFLTFGCPAGSTPGCPTVNNGFAWNHGSDNPETAKTWVGYVGPTVRNLGQTSSIWTDHTDVRPTMLALLGLKDGYSQDGRFVAQIAAPAALPPGLHGDELRAFERLAAIYKQIEAPFGRFGHDSEIVSTTAVASSSPNDWVYLGFDRQLQACGTQRDQLGAQINGLLQGATFGGVGLNERTAERLIDRAQELLAGMQRLTRMATPPEYNVCGER